MSQVILKCARSISMLAAVCAIFSVAMAQQNAPASFADTVSTINKSILDTEPPPAPILPTRVVEGLLKAEAQVRESLNQHSFRRDVTLQTIGLNDKVTGEYIRNSQFIFDDRGQRIERVLYHPRSSLRGLRITKEDIQDLAGAQLLGIDISESVKYRMNYAAVESLNGRDLLAIDITPARRPDPHRMRERFFVGRVWVDPDTFQIVKVRGITEPQGKQRFPLFETSRAATDTGYVFPTITEADDVLHFPQGDVRYRIRVRYYDYKRFGSRIKIVEIADASDR